MTSRFDPLFVSLLQGVAADEQLGDLFAGRADAWLDWGLPPSQDPQEAGLSTYPCIRATLLNSRNNRQGEYSFAITFWMTDENLTDEESAADTTARVDRFIDLSEALQEAMNAARNIQVPNGFIHRPEPQKGLHSSLWNVVFVAGRAGLTN